MKRLTYDHYFLLLAKTAALRSSCNSRPGGAVIVRNNRVLTTGMTGTIRGTFQCCDKGVSYCHRRHLGVSDDNKYNTCPSIHAEANAMDQAAQLGVSIDGATMYCTLQPCVLCIKRIASVGINRVVFEHPYDSINKDRDDDWSELALSYKVVCECLALPKNIRKLASENVLGITSKRKLKSQ